MQDKLFLLSLEEYEKYKDKIPPVYGWWWLRPSDNSPYNAIDINLDLDVFPNTYRVDDTLGGVRPAFYTGPCNGANIWGLYHGELVKWVCLDRETGLYLAGDNLEEHRFDGVSGDYETSEVRELLKEMEREIFTIKGDEEYGR